MSDLERTASVGGDAPRVVDRIIAAASEDPEVAPVIHVLRDALARDAWTADELERLLRAAARELEGGG